MSNGIPNFNEVWKPLVVGVCACGQPATMHHKVGIAPGEWTEPVAICQACFEKILAVDEDPYESEEYARFVDSVSDQCRCRGTVCAGVLAGGFCDTSPDDERALDFLDDDE